MIFMRKMVKDIMETSKSGKATTHLGTPDSAVNCDLLVPSDTERSDRVAGFGEHWRLASQRLQHL